MKKELKDQAIILRNDGWSVNRIAKQLNVAKSTVSLWTRGVNLTEEQKNKLISRQINDAQAMATSNYWRKKRIANQRKGRNRIKLNEPLYIAGCMLYWGEGSKSINKCELSNSNASMIFLFKNFLFNYFNISENEIKISINAYTTYHSEEDIIEYWMSNLKIKKDSIVYTRWNKSPKSSKQKKTHSSNYYGTCNLVVNRTDIVQEIFGAIQEFGNFSNDEWLNGVSK